MPTSEELPPQPRVRVLFLDVNLDGLLDLVVNGHIDDTVRNIDPM